MVSGRLVRIALTATGGVLAAGLQASATARTPATMPGAASRPTISPNATDLSEKERIALQAVRDETRSLDETAFYMLLGKVAKRGTVVRPTVKDLLAQPATYRAAAIRLTLHVDTVRKLLPNKGLSPSRYLLPDQPVWRLDCLNAEAKYPGDEPVVVFTTTEPAFLPKPKETTNHGDWLYSFPGPKIETVGLFYKVYRAKSRGDEQKQPEWRNYPVLVAWQFRKIDKPATNLGLKALPIVVLMILALCVAFLFLKRQMKRQTEGLEPYSRRRAEPGTRSGATSAPARPRGRRDQVDPLLAKAAEAYRKERHGGDGKDDQG